MLLARLEMYDGGVRFLICAAVLAVAAVLALRKSSYLVDYFIVVVCLNRFVRRLLDWSDGQYDERPITSLLPLIIGGFAALVVVSRHRSMPAKAQRAFYYLVAAVAYGFVMGIGNGSGALFALGDYVMPFGLLFYGAAIGVDLTTLDRWIRTMVICALGVAAYGWYQWAIVPPWDRDWLMWSGMWTSMGQPIPYQMSICSTLESRGPFAWFLVAAALPMIAAGRWRRVGGWAAVAFLVAATLPSTVRSGWAILLAGAAAYAAFRGGQSLVRIGAVLALLVFGGLYGARYLPESERLIARAESVTAIQNDSSFQGRLHIASQGFGIILSQPFGYGLGSTGLASKVTSRSGVIGDNGVLEILANFGLPGFVLLAGGFGMLAQQAYEQVRRSRSPYACLALAQLFSGACALVFANWLAGPYSGMSLVTLGVVAATAAGEGHRWQPSLPTPVDPTTVYPVRAIQ